MMTGVTPIPGNHHVLLDVLGQLSALLEGFHVLQRLQLRPLRLGQPAPSNPAAGKKWRKSVGFSDLSLALQIPSEKVFRPPKQLQVQSQSRCLEL